MHPLAKDILKNILFAQCKHEKGRKRERESNTKDNLRILENLMSTLSTHTDTHSHTSLAFFGSKGNVRQIQGSNIMHLVRATEQKCERESKGRGNIQQTRIKNAKRKKKGATGTANLADYKKKPFNTRCDESQTINAHIKDKLPLRNNEFEMLSKLNTL